MRTHAKIKIMKRIVIALAALALLFSVYHYRDYLLYSAQLRAKPGLKDELQRLKNPLDSKNPGLVAMALVRLATDKTPEGKNAALERVGHENPAIRAAAARAIIYYSVKENKIKSAIETLLIDSDHSVRLALLESIQNRYEDERKSIIENFLRRTDLTPEEILMAVLSAIPPLFSMVAFIFPFCMGCGKLLSE